MKRYAAFAAVALAGWPELAYACEKCFGGGDTETAHAISLAMLALVVMTGIIWGGIGAFFMNMRHRARRLEPGDLVVTEDGDIQSSTTDRPHPPPPV